MNKEYSRLGYVLLFLFLYVSLFPTPARALFVKTLKIGDKGYEVKALQVFLNSATSTRIADFGPGSPGQETEMYGLLTKKAVSAFQELYFDEILRPNGLFRGTGIFGPATRTKANAIVEKTGDTMRKTPEKPYVEPNLPPAVIPPIVPILPTIPVSAPMATSAVPVIMQSKDPGAAYLAALLQDASRKKPNIVTVSKHSGAPGSTFMVYGSGFTDERNTLKLGDSYTISDLQAENGSIITVRVPYGLASGKYPLTVVNSLGESNKNAFFVITAPSLVPPVITKVIPEAGPYGAEVVIQGQGFTGANEIITQYGNFENIPSSDGKTIRFTFTFPPFEKMQQLKSAGKNVPDLNMPIQINVVNKGGATESPVVYTVQIRK